MVYRSIWESTYYELNTSNDYFNYSIQFNGDDIFRGKAYKQPGKSTIKININKICQNYLSNVLPQEMFLSTNYSYDNYEAVKVFDLVNSDNNSILEQYTFLYDWSFDFEFRGSTNQNGMSLSKPIDGVSYNNADGIKSTLMLSGGKWFVRTQRINYQGTGCSRFGMYYLNTYGGWDYFLFKGKARQTDSYNRYDISYEFDNKSLEFEKAIYNNQISTIFNLNSGRLSKEQSFNFAKNLMATNVCYLKDYDNNGAIYPALINNQSTQYKDYIPTDGVINYNIDVELSQQKQNI